MRGGRWAVGVLLGGGLVVRLWLGWRPGRRGSTLGVQLLGVGAIVFGPAFVLSSAVEGQIDAVGSRPPLSQSWGGSEGTSPGGR